MAKSEREIFWISSICIHFAGNAKHGPAVIMMSIRRDNTPTWEETVGNFLFFRCQKRTNLRVPCGRHTYGVHKHLFRLEWDRYVLLIRNRGYNVQGLRLLEFPKKKKNAIVLIVTIHIGSRVIYIVTWSN